MGPLQPSEQRLKVSNWALVIAANLALWALVSVSPGHPVYDEAWFLDTLKLLRQHAFPG